MLWTKMDSVKLWNCIVRTVVMWMNTLKAITVFWIWMFLLVWFVKHSVSLWCTIFVFFLLQFFICVNLLLAVNLSSKGGRKLLQKDLNNNSTTQGDSKPVSSYQVGIFAGGALLVCCAIVCPCFYAKRRKATAHTVLEKDSNSSELMFIYIYFYQLFFFSKLSLITLYPNMCIQDMLCIPKKGRVWF